MISVAEAIARIAGAFQPLPSETVAIANASDRALAKDVTSLATQPPYDVSSMDGYAVRASDAMPGATLTIIGSSPAGHPFAGRVSNGEAVRIFTGGVIPAGADAIIIQEDTTAAGGAVTINEGAKSGRHIRSAGLDFKVGDVLGARGHRLTARDLSLLAAADVAHVDVVRKPRIMFVATGDELSRPSEPRKPGGIVASSGYALSALVTKWGGEAIDLGILPDTVDAIAGIAANATEADLLVTIGGASVGDHDLVQKALGPQGFALDFWRIAMRPGKPMIFGKLGKTPLLGLPGNPVSTLVCALLFLKPAILAMLNTQTDALPLKAKLMRDVGENDSRQDYLRARLAIHEGERWVDPFPVQDSSMQSVFARSDALVVRAPNAPSAKRGEAVEIFLLD